MSAREAPRPGGEGAGGAPGRQVVISGVGGQGVVFLGRLLAEAAIRKGLPVLTSETHGMAQRGGTVVAHVKIGTFSSPLVRPGRADVLLVLKAEGAVLHGGFLRDGGLVVANASVPPAVPDGARLDFLDADVIALENGAGKAVNLIVLGRALAAKAPGAAPPLLVTAADVRDALEGRMAGDPALLAASLRALDLGSSREDPARR